MKKKLSLLLALIMLLGTFSVFPVLHAEETIQSTRYDFVTFSRGFLDTDGLPKIAAPNGETWQPVPSTDYAWGTFRTEANANNATELPCLGSGTAHMIDIGSVEKVNAFYYSIDTRKLAYTDYEFWYSVDGVTYTKISDPVVAQTGNPAYVYSGTNQTVDYKATFEELEARYFAIYSTSGVYFGYTSRNFYMAYEEVVEEDEEAPQDGRYDFEVLYRAFADTSYGIGSLTVPTGDTWQPGNGMVAVRTKGTDRHSAATPLPDLAGGSAHMIDIGSVQTVNSFVYSVEKARVAAYDQGDGVYRHYGLTDDTAGKVTYWYSVDGVTYTKLDVAVEATSGEYYAYDGSKEAMEFKASFSDVEARYLIVYSEGNSQLIFAYANANMYLMYEEVVAPDYTATLTGPATDVTVGDEVTFTVNVDNTFAAGEVTLTYDKTLLTPVAGEGIKIDDGIVTVVTYGADKTSVNVVFEAKAAGTAQVALKDAAFSAKEDAATEDLTDAAIETSEASVVIALAEFAVTLPEIFEGNSAVANGNDYTFTAKDTNNYNYALPTATVNGEAATVIDNEDGTYTVKNVTGVLVITGTRTEKTYNATVTGNGAEDVTLPEAKPTYGTDYVLTLPVTNEEYTYTVTVKIGDGEAIPVTSATYTIAGADITGDIVVNVTKTEIVPETVTVTLAGNANDAVVNFVGTVNKGDAYTLTINPVKGYTYTVTATMGGETVTLDTSVANAYTVAAATADIEFTVTATLDKSGVAVNEYVQLDGTKMWLVKVTTELADGKTYTYGGNAMYYSEAHGAYVYLVVANELTVDTAKAAVDATTGTAASFATDVAYDVNKSGKPDANDAQLVYNMYNATYATIDESVTMEKFLLADANADGIVDTEDAVKIVAEILK